MISRTEMVWRHLLVAALDLGIRRTSLTQLSAELDLPVSTIHKALERPRALGALRGSARGLRVLDPKRLQLMWAAQRDLNKDIDGDGNQVRRRFQRRRGQPNLLILEPDPLLSRYGRVAPRCQVFSDLINLPTWQSQRFLGALDGDVLGDVA